MDERDRWQAPGYQPAPGLQTTGVDSWRDLETVTEPVRGRGSLPGLALVVGLIGFFVADAITGGPNPGTGDPTPPPGGDIPAGLNPNGPNVLATFLIAAGAVILLFLVAVTLALIIRRTRRPASIPVGAVKVRAKRPPLRRLLSARFASTAVNDWLGSAQPGSTRSFLRAVDELLAAADTLPDRHIEQIEEDLLRFAASAAPADLHLLLKHGAASAVYHEVNRFGWLADQMTTPQLRYLTVVIEARRGLR